MNIEGFVAQSLGKWRSMRSGHSLAFQQFEDVLSEIEITPLSSSSPDVLELINISSIDNISCSSPFAMNWAADSDWEPDDPTEVSSGSCILVPMPNNENSGILLRSIGYAEKTQAKSTYRFLDDGTFVLSTHYEQSIAEERIWFVSDNVRCRSSVLKTSEGNGILQASFSSEVRRLKP